MRIFIQLLAFSMNYLIIFTENTYNELPQKILHKFPIYIKIFREILFIQYWTAKTYMK